MEKLNTTQRIVKWLALKLPRLSKKYDYKKTLKKAGIALLYYGTPALVAYLRDYNPAVLSLTVGTILTMLQNIAKNAFQEK